MWGHGQHQPNPWMNQGQYYFPPPPPPQQIVQVPAQVLVAFRILDSLAEKEEPIVAATSVAVESVERKELLPVEQKARAAAIDLLIAYMRSALQ